MKNYHVVLLVILSAVFGYVASAHAGDFFVVSVHSYHWNRNDVKAKPATKPVCVVAVVGVSETCTFTNATGGLNENNFGLGYEHTNGNSVYGAGFYNNSESRPSIYVSYAYLPIHLGNFSAGPIADLATGYTVAPVVGMAGVEVQYLVGNAGVNLIMVPSVTVNNAKAIGFAGLQVKFKL